MRQSALRIATLEEVAYYGFENLPKGLIPPMMGGDGGYKSLILSASGLIGYWRLNETSGTISTDLSSGAHNGTYQGGYTQGQAGELVGDPATATSFNGVSGSHVSLPVGVSLTSGSAVTVEFWMRVASVDSGGSAFTIGNVNTPNRCQAHVPWTDNILYWDHGSDRVSVDYTPYYGSPTHVALVSTGSGNTFTGIYLNGVLVASHGLSGNPTALTGGYIGEFPVANTYSKGTIQEFALYNVVLSASQVAMHYAVGRGARFNQSGARQATMGASVR